MSEKREVYKCLNCGAIVAVLKEGEGRLSCCNTEMAEVTPDEGKRLIHDLARPGAP